MVMPFPNVLYHPCHVCYYSAIIPRCHCYFILLNISASTTRPSSSSNQSSPISFIHQANKSSATSLSPESQPSELYRQQKFGNCTQHGDPAHQARKNLSIIPIPQSQSFNLDRYQLQLRIRIISSNIYLKLFHTIYHELMTLCIPKSIPGKQPPFGVNSQVLVDDIVHFYICMGGCLLNIFVHKNV